MSPAKAKRLPPDLDSILRRGVIEIIPEQEFIDALGSGRKLRLKLGLDPSKPDLHIGHAVLLRKLRRLQELGHQVVLIVGDWTAQIGDPSGQSITRPMLTADEVKANAETYMRQFFHVVDREKTEVRWQSEWFGKFTLEDVVRLAARFTVAQMLQRDDFRQRFEAHKPLGIHELLYPLLQAHDSVVIEADVEFGGSDQRFNLLVGRELQGELGQRPQVCFIMHLLVGRDGRKMSKSLGNTIDFEDPPDSKFGKVMNLPDDLLMDYLELATEFSDDDVARFRKQLEDPRTNRMEIKEQVAWDIVRQFHGTATANEELATFRMTYRARGAEDVIFLPASTVDLVLPLRGGRMEISLPHRLFEVGLVPSVSDGRRLVRQGGVELIGWSKGAFQHSLHRTGLVRIHNPTIEVEHGQVFRVGKYRYLRILDEAQLPEPL